MLHINPYIYTAINEFDSSCAPIPAPLTEHYAQCAEDVIVEALLSAFRNARKDLQPESLKYVEIGANHPISGSNTFLLYRRGYKGILVEANPKLIPELKRIRTNDIVINMAITPDDASHVDLHISNQNELSSLHKDFVTSWHDGAIGLAETIRVPAMRINKLFEQHIGISNFAFLSIDIEGMDLSVLEDIDYTKWRPLLIQAEPSEHFNHGSAQSMTDFMRSKDYMLIAATGVNQLYADRLFLNTILPSLSDVPSLVAQIQYRLAETEKLLLSSQEQHVKTQEELAQKQAELQAVTSSTLWKIMDPVRKMHALLHKK